MSSGLVAAKFVPSKGEDLVSFDDGRRTTSLYGD
jgi:hypothetical protein